MGRRLLTDEDKRKLKAYTDEKVKEVNQGGGASGDYALKSELPTKTSQLENDSGFLVEVPSEYVTEEELNSKGYLKEHQSLEGYATKEDIKGKQDKLSEWQLNSINNTPHTVDGLVKDVDSLERYIDEQVGTAMEFTQSVLEIADEASTKADTNVSEHNTSDKSHNDIRLSIQELANRLNTIANSDDISLDQLSEIVAYIKNNKSLIDGITTSKVNVSDIIDNLTTSVSNKPLSAKQGVELKNLINGIVVPTLLSELGQDATHRLVTDAEKQNWNSKSNFSGKFGDLTNKPTTLEGYGITDGATKEEVDGKQPKGNYALKSDIPNKTSQLTNDSGFLTQHQDISGKVDKSSAETWIFTLSDGSTTTKKVVLA